MNSVNQIEPNVLMPVIRYGGVAYPVLFAVASIKRWAEYRGKSYLDGLQEWGKNDLSDEDWIALLRIVLESGERRRRLSATDENHVITDELIAELFETYHLNELWEIIVTAWDQPPGRAPDPPTAALLPTGAESLD